MRGLHEHFVRHACQRTLACSLQIYCGHLVWFLDSTLSLTQSSGQCYCFLLAGKLGTLGEVRIIPRLSEGNGTLEVELETYPNFPSGVSNLSPIACIRDVC